MANETNIIQKSAYLRGLADGMKLSANSDDTSKLLLAMIDCIDSIAVQVNDNTDLICELDDEVDSCSDSLDAFAELVFGIDDDDDEIDINDDDDLFVCDDDDDDSKCFGCSCPGECDDCCCDEDCEDCNCDGRDDDCCITCPYCDARVPLSTLLESDNPVCGNCHMPLCSSTGFEEESDS